MDILLDRAGDMYISQDGDIRLGDCVAQKIRIRLLWFENEWRWDTDEGLPYMTHLFIKNPETDYFESIVREKIFEVDEVVDVKDVKVTFDRRTREAAIRFTAITDEETIKEEVKIKCLDTE